MREFSKQVQDSLKYYVYALYKPNEELPFYIGKGKGNRVFAHIREAEEIKKHSSELSEKNVSKKLNIILELLNSGREPIIEILRHGLENENEALVAEAVAIDLINHSLSNKQSGHKSREFGRKDVNRILHQYDEDAIEITEPAVLIRINTYYNPETQIVELYDRVRSSWVLNKNRAEKAQYVFAVYQSKILEVYKVAAWLEGESTMLSDGSRSYCYEEIEGGRVRSKRIEFVGLLAEKALRQKYCGKHVEGFAYGAQNPCSYKNI